MYHLKTSKRLEQLEHWKERWFGNKIALFVSINGSGDLGMGKVRGRRGCSDWRNWGSRGGLEVEETRRHCVNASKERYVLFFLSWRKPASWGPRAVAPLPPLWAGPVYGLLLAGTNMRARFPLQFLAYSTAFSRSTMDKSKHTLVVHTRRGQNAVVRRSMAHIATHRQRELIRIGITGRIILLGTGEFNFMCF
jgi:hypothetical protein